MDRPRPLGLLLASAAALGAVLRVLAQLIIPPAANGLAKADDFFLVVPAAALDEEVQALIDNLAKQGIAARQAARTKRSRMLALKADFSVLLLMAENAGVRRTTQTGALVPFSVEAKSDFEGIDKEDTFFTSAERLFLLNDVIVNHPDIARLKWPVFPCINYGEAARLSSKWVFSIAPQPYAEIRAYLGEEITFYFAFLGTYTTWLTLPAFLGLLTYWYQIQDDDDFAFDNVPTIAYSVFLVIWTTLFLEAWKRKQQRLAFAWGTEAFEDEESELPTYTKHCVAVFDEATRKEKRVLPALRVALAYSFSLLACTTLVIVAGTSMIACLSLADHAKVHWVKWPGYWRFAVYAPTIAYSLLINVFSTLNKSLAVFTTELELHRTESEERDAVAVKLVALQFVNLSAGLAYCAFVKFDLNKLRTTLSTLLIVNQITGQFFEVGLPLVKAAIKSVLGQNHDAGAKEANRQGGPSAEDELNLETYAGVFSDYLEMWVQFGQVILFASVWPLAALMALLNNIMEIRTDAFKIIHASRRPFPRRAASIGSWLVMFDALSFACVLTNVGLVAVVAKESPHFQRVFGEMETWKVCLLFVLAEHVVIGLKVIIRALVSDVPEDVQDQQRDIRLAEKAAKKAIIEQRVRLDGMLARLRAGGSVNFNDNDAKSALAAYVAEVTMHKEHMRSERVAMLKELQHLKAAKGEEARWSKLATLANIAAALLSFLVLVIKSFPQVHSAPLSSKCLYAVDS